MLFRFMRLLYSFEIISDWTKSTLASASRIQTAVCLFVVEVLYDIRGLYVGLVVRASFSRFRGKVQEFWVEWRRPFWTF